MNLLTRLLVAGESIFANRNAPAEVKQHQSHPEAVKDDPVPEVVVQKDSQKFGREARVVMTIFSMLVAGLLVLWYYWDEEYLKNDEDLIYNLGLVGGIMMLLQFVYALRKRITRMRSWGKLKIWFGVHTFIGLSAPVITVIHSRFDLQSINGSVAFFSMLLVVFSGIVGRYLYSQINFDLTETRDQLKRMHAQMQQHVIGHHKDIVQDVEQQLKAFMVNAFATPTGVVHAFVQSFGIGIRSRLLYLHLIQLRQINASGVNGGAVLKASGEPVFDRRERKILRAYLKTLTKLARYNAFKQLFGLWRIGHVPVIYLLLITGLAHVLAVHMY